MPSIILSDNGVSSGSAGLKSVAASDGALALQTTTAGGTATTAVTIGTDQSVTLAGTLAVQSQNISPYTGFKNRIINGAMVIDQRNAGASVTPSSGAYTLDRWCTFQTQSSKYTIQQNAGSVTPPAGFTNYLGLTVGASANVTVGASDYFLLDHIIEGYNMADLAWGSASAATVTLSFWVRSSVTGTFGGSLKSYQGTSYGYPFTYTINAANTWEQKTITIAGPTSTWSSSTTNGGGVEVIFSLGSGSTFSGPAGAWASTAKFSANGATNLISTNSATFYITGVQLEKGSTATSFDYRPYGTELQLCQRYFARFNSFSNGYVGIGAGVCEGASSISVVVKYPVAMRSSPTASGSNLATYDGGSVRAITAFATQYNGSDALNINLTVGGGGMTQYRPATLIGNNGGTGYFDLSAEL